MQGVTTTGGPAILVLALFVGVFVSIALAGVIAYRTYRGYQRTHSTRLLALSAGLFTVVAVPKLLNLALSTLQYQADTTSTVAAATRLAGLCIVLYAIYAGD
ncbi:hypothetical protein [Haloarchaeobius sp. FL176]|uniref:DUF7521 family protein n=1 Tax=Haloarchaeobius sp. FL176 TaxID=2967129 RepID=UPI00214723B6|nr:hypothetical protein [Haloarchaeobius sp. FL176]